MNAKTITYDLSTSSYTAIPLQSSLLDGPKGMWFSRFFPVDINVDGNQDVLVVYHDGTSLNTNTPLQVRLLVSDGKTLIDKTNDLGLIGVKTVITRSVFFGDFNEDEKLDIFIANHGTEKFTPSMVGEQNRLLLSESNRYKDTTGNLPSLTDASHGGGVGDFNKDGHLDIYVNNIGDDDHNESYFLFGDGAGNFTFAGKAHDLVSDYPSGFDNGLYAVTGDFNKDGATDVFTIPTTYPEFKPLDKYFVSNGDGTFRFSNQLPAITNFKDTSANFEDLYSVDVNRDGNLDVIAYQSRPSVDGERYVIYIGDGKGNFSYDPSRIPADLPRLTGLASTHVGDFNHDGSVDVFQIGWNSDGTWTPNSYYLQNDGNGYFSKKVWKLPKGPVGDLDGNTCPLDINNDGAPDLISFPYPGTFMLYVNHPSLLKDGRLFVTDIVTSGKSKSVYKTSDNTFAIAASGAQTGTVLESYTLLKSSNSKTYVPKNPMTLLENVDGTYALISKNTSNSKINFSQQKFNSDGTLSGKISSLSLAQVLSSETLFNVDINGDGAIGNVVTKILESDGCTYHPELRLFSTTSGNINLASTNVKLGDPANSGTSLMASKNKNWDIPSGSTVIGIAITGGGSLEVLTQKGNQYAAQAFDMATGIAKGKVASIKGSQVESRENFYNLDLNGDAHISLVGESKVPEGWSV